MYEYIQKKIYSTALCFVMTALCVALFVCSLALRPPQSVDVSPDKIYDNCIRRVVEVKASAAHTGESFGTGAADKARYKKYIMSKLPLSRL